MNSLTALAHGAEVDNCDPTLNGHPMLTLTEAKRWFIAVGCNVQCEGLFPFIDFLNRSELTGILWKDDPAFKALRNGSPSAQRCVRAASALATLASELPA